jgi:hypothetical protein
MVNQFNVQGFSGQNQLTSLPASQVNLRGHFFKKGQTHFMKAKFSEFSYSLRSFLSNTTLPL